MTYVHTNGIPQALGVGMPSTEFRRQLAKHTERTDKRIAKGEKNVDHPVKLGMAMLLNVRGNVYGDEGRVPAAVVQRRRSANKAARQARAKARR